MDPAIHGAIAERRLLQFRYHGGVRVVEPCHGLMEELDEVLRACQIGDTARSGTAWAGSSFGSKGWRTKVLPNDTFNEKHPDCDIEEEMKEVHCRV